MKTIKQYEIIDHGIEHSQYFRGCGVCYTNFDDVATGIGSSCREAANDAAECLAQAGWDVSSCKTMNNEIDGLPSVDEPEIIEQDEDGELWYYVSIRVK